jgi:hypothetical protein
MWQIAWVCKHRKYTSPFPQTSSSGQNIKRDMQGLHFRDPKYFKTIPPKTSCLSPETNTRLWHLFRGHGHTSASSISHTLNSRCTWCQKILRNLAVSCYRLLLHIQHKSVTRCHNKCHVIFHGSSTMIVVSKLRASSHGRASSPLPRGSNSLVQR